MSANEIAERIAASCWVQFGSDGGEEINEFDNQQVRFRSLVGFQQRIITTTNASAFPLFLLPLDRTLSRTECAVFAVRHGTAGPGSAADAAFERASYPNSTIIPAAFVQAFIQPIMLEWLGPDLTAPVFMPFGLDVGVIPATVPAGFDLDLFDTIALLLPLPAASALSGDVSILVLKHPKREGDTVVQAVLPIPVAP